MKNLKKALSLILALAMMCSLLVAGASAANFSDNEEIAHAEAVDVLTELGVIGGYPDGTFKPANIVTRAEMCKMICIAMNGGTDPILGADALSLFSDTKDHWANAYIAYCYNLLIVSGDAGKGGTFRPDAPVTAVEAAKMMLVAMGYSSDVEKYTGADWAINVSVRANSIGLFDGIANLLIGTGLTRDNAAQLLYNGINANMVKYNYALVPGPNGSLVSMPQLEERKGESVLTEKFHLTRIEGIVRANEYADLDNPETLPAGKTNVRVTNMNVNTPNNELVFNTTTGKELLGRSVVFYVKPSTSAPLGTTTATSDKVMGKVLEANVNNVATRTAAFGGATTTAREDAFKAFIKAAGLKNATNIEFYWNGADSGAGTLGEADFANGVESILIDNDDDGVIDIILQEISYFTQVTAYNATKETLTLSGIPSEIKFDDAVGAADVAKNDYVLATNVDGVYHLAVAESISGLMSIYNNDTTTIAGTKYSYSVVANAPMTDVYDALPKNYVGTVGSRDLLPSSIGTHDTYKYFLDAYGFIVACTLDESGDFKDYAAVVESGINTSGALSADPVGQVKLLLADGTTATYTIDMKASYPKFATQMIANATLGASSLNNFARYIAKSSQWNVNQGLNLLVNTVVRYSVNSDGTVTLQPGSFTTVPAGSAVVTKNTVSYTFNGTGVLFNNTTIFVYNDGGSPAKFSAVTGVGNIGAGDAIALNLIKGMQINATTKVAQLVYVVGQAPASGAAKYAYVFGNPDIGNENNKDYAYYQAVNESGEVFTLQVEMGGTMPVPGAVCRYTQDAAKIAKIEHAGTVDTNGTLVADEFVAGQISRIVGDVITVIYANGEPHSFSIGKVSAFNAAKASEVSAGTFLENQSIVISTKKDGTDIILGTAFIAEQTMTKGMTVYFNGTARYTNVNPGTPVTFTDANWSVGDVTYTTPVVVPGFSVDATSGEITFLMPYFPVSITGNYKLTITDAGSLGAVYRDSALTVAVTSGSQIAAGTTLYVKEVASAGTGLTITGMGTVATLTTPAAGTSGVYSVVMPAAVSTLTIA